MELIRPQWQIYTDDDLSAGAVRWNLTIAQERERIRLLQSDYISWPISLKQFLLSVYPGDYPGLPTTSIDVIQLVVVRWIKQMELAKLAKVNAKLDAELDAVLAPIPTPPSLSTAA